MQAKDFLFYNTSDPPKLSWTCLSIDRNNLVTLKRTKPLIPSKNWDWFPIAQSKEFNKELIKGNPIHYYSMMKQLTVWGYLSSEKVGTQVLRHVPIPGRYEGCLPYEKGEKAYSWAT